MRQNDKENPFIHLFQTAFGYYLYDVNTNQIIKIKQDTYERLSNQEKGYKTDTNEEIEILYENGYLKNNKVQNVNHPYTELLPYALENKIHILILQVTQNCNLRCDYCLYSGKYNTRSHQNKRMNFSVAKEAIDFLKEHSKEKRKVYIAFYGGEPLLEFELIKKCVTYAENIMKDSGTYLYMLSQSISIDSMIVNIPYFTELLQESQNVNNEIERIVGIKAYINVLPKYLDIAVSEEEGRADYLTLSTNFIIDKINKIDDERLYCSDDYESLSSLTMQIIDELSSYAGNNEVQEINNIVIEDVEEKVMEIIKQIGEKDCAIDCLKNESLFGEKIKMRARDMLVVFFELEKQFDICFTEDDIKDYTFVSIEKISACIKKHLNK